MFGPNIAFGVAHIPYKFQYRLIPFRVVGREGPWVYARATVRVDKVEDSGRRSLAEINEYVMVLRKERGVWGCIGGVMLSHQESRWITPASVSR